MAVHIGTSTFADMPAFPIFSDPLFSSKKSSSEPLYSSKKSSVVGKSASTSTGSSAAGSKVNDQQVRSTFSLGTGTGARSTTNSIGFTTATQQINLKNVGGNAFEKVSTGRNGQGEKLPQVVVLKQASISSSSQQSNNGEGIIFKNVEGNALDKSSAVSSRLVESSSQIGVSKQASTYSSSQPLRNGGPLLGKALGPAGAYLGNQNPSETALDKEFRVRADDLIHLLRLVRPDNHR